MALVFAFALVPAIGLFGLAADFAGGLSAKRRLDSAADAAVLRAVSVSSNPNLDQPTRDAAMATFTAELGSAPGLIVSSVDMTSAYTGGNLQVIVAYKAQISTRFGSLFGVPTVSISGTATSVASNPSYANYYLLLDNSPSMGIGATTGDISRLQSLTGGCAFACHEHTFDSARIIGDNTNDNYHIAKANNVTTRIDVERQAAQSLFDSAKSKQKYKDQYRAAIYTFSDVLQTIAPLSADLDTVQQLAANVDLAYSYLDHRDTQTSYDTAMTYMSNIVGTGGDGQTSSNPLTYLFIVTDGVEDEPTGSGSGNNNQPDRWKSSSETSPPSSSQPNIANTIVGNFSNNNRRLIATISSGSSTAINQCQAMKDNGVKIAILYTQYLPVTNDNLYNTYVAPISNQIPRHLQACASQNLFFTVTPSQGIPDAMLAMFAAATSGRPRLTQ